MNKQKFTIEIDSSDYAEPISVTYLMAMLRMGFSEANMSNLSILSIEENNVEQNVERPSNKTIELLEKAESILSDSEYHYHRCFSRDIEEHLKEIRGETK